MSNDTSKGAGSASGDRGEQLAELGLPLEELVRRGAREILLRAIEAEVEQAARGIGRGVADGRTPSGHAQRPSAGARDPRLAVGDGAPGFWGALDQVYLETVHQRCWFHKMGNVLNALPKALHGKAKADLETIWMAPTRKQATQAFKRFVNRYGAKYLKAAEKLEKDREALLACFAFPAEHWVHIRTSNPIASTFATVRYRTGRTKNCVTRATFLGLAFKMSEEAAKTWRRIRAPEKVAELLGGARYEDGIPVSDNPPETQEEQREDA